jgi:hypothetical protein
MNKLLVIILLTFSLSANALDKIDLADYVTDFTGKTDQTTNIQTAEAEAYRLKLPLFHPGGIILSGYILFREPVFANPGYWTGLATFKSNVTSGIAYETTSLNISNLRFLGNPSTTTGPVNAIGLVAGHIYYPSRVVTSAGSLSRGYISNVMITGFSTGFQGYGWINKIDALLINYCTLGAIFDSYNGAVIDFTGEQNKQDFILFHSAGTTFTRLVLEGSVGNKPSIIDLSQGIQIDSMYLEQRGRTAPWLQLGDTYTNNTINISAGNVERCGVGCTSIVNKSTTNFTGSFFNYD